MVKLNDGNEVDLELFKFDACPYCVRVYRQIERQQIQGIWMRDTRKDPRAAQELIQRGGKLQVPCLFIDGKPMYESLDINAWLEANVAS